MSPTGACHKLFVFENIDRPYTSLSETCQGWRFGLTPLPSLRSKAHKVIQEILPYIPVQYPIKLGHAKFPTCISCLHTTLYSLSAITKHAFPIFVVHIENPHNVHLGNFRKHWKLHICGVYNTLEVGNATFLTVGS